MFSLLVNKLCLFGLPWCSLFSLLIMIMQTLHSGFGLFYWHVTPMLWARCLTFYMQYGGIEINGFFHEE
jgi:hypothetical protein